MDAPVPAQLRTGRHSCTQLVVQYAIWRSLTEMTVTTSRAVPDTSLLMEERSKLVHWQQRIGSERDVGRENQDGRRRVGGFESLFRRSKPAALDVTGHDAAVVGTFRALRLHRSRANSVRPAKPRERRGPQLRKTKSRPG